MEKRDAAKTIISEHINVNLDCLDRSTKRTQGSHESKTPVIENIKLRNRGS